MKRLLILMASVLLCTAVVGQEVDRTEEFRQLYVTLSRAYAKNPDDVANLIDLARYYSHPDSPQRNLATAATHLVRAEALYTAWLQDRGRYRDLQKLIKKGITLNLIRQQHQTVIEQAELYVRTHAPAMGTMERETYLATFAEQQQYVVHFIEDNLGSLTTLIALYKPFNNRPLVDPSNSFEFYEAILEALQETKPDNPHTLHFKNTTEHLRSAIAHQ